MKRFLGVLLAFAVVFCGASCSKSGESSAKSSAGKKGSAKKIAVSILAPSDAEWGGLTDKISAAFEKEGWDVETVFEVSSDVSQPEQILKCVEGKKDAIVLIPISEGAVAESVEKAKAAGVAVIGVDGSIRPDWTASVAFDPKKEGEAIGSAIVQTFSLENAGAESRSYNAEFFMGSSEKADAAALYAGMFDVLGGYVDSGVLKSKTGRTSFQDTSVLSDSNLTARDFCRNYIRNYYGSEKLSIVCAASDSILKGVSTAISAEKGVEAPSVFAVGGTNASLGLVKSGLVKALAYKDPAKIASKTVEVLTKIGGGEALAEGDSLCESTVVTAENVDSVNQ